MRETTPKIFISYAWTNDLYKEKVIEFAKRLISNGVDVKLDVWDLKEGQDKFRYMEQMVRDETIDKVLLLINPVYTEKANERLGGVGTETTIITSKVYDNAEQTKFIPVIFESINGNFELPIFLETRIFINLDSKDENCPYEENFEKLLRILWEEEAYKKPPLGTKPNFESRLVTPELTGLKHKVSSFLSARRISEYDVNEFEDLLDEYAQAATMFVMEKPTGEEAYKQFNDSLEFRNLGIDLIELVIKHQKNDNVCFKLLKGFFEKMWNYSMNSGNYMERSDNLEVVKILIWELFVITFSILFDKARYFVIRNLLQCGYFLNHGSSYGEKICSYLFFRQYSSLIEENYKNSLDNNLVNLLNLVGHTVVTSRVYRNIVTKQSFSEADVMLTHMSAILDLRDFEDIHVSKEWFPKTYPYCEYGKMKWNRLKSKEFCKEIFPLFYGRDFDLENQSIQTLINSIKTVVENAYFENRVYYSRDPFDSCPPLRNCIQIDDIGKLN